MSDHERVVKMESIFYRDGKFIWHDSILTEDEQKRIDEFNRIHKELMDKFYQAAGVPRKYIE
ncbi:hypothetical protein ACI3ER_11310 [Bacillus sp. Wb]